MKQKVFAVWLAAVLLLAGCGGNTSSIASTGFEAADSMPGAASGGDNYWDMDSGDHLYYESEESQLESIYRDPNAKLIRRAELNIQTEQFDQSLEALNQLTADCGGYFETANLYGGSRRDASANRWGEYTVRVPAENYDRFLSSTGDLGYITSKNESSENVGEQYYDTEARLKTQRTKQDRLLALLEKAETMEDIIALESALSEVEYQIEQYSSTLNRYDALIGYSTFSIDLNEVGQVTQEVGETASLGARMAAGFQSSFRGLVRGSQDVLVWLSYNLFLVIVLAVAAGAAVVIGRRALKKLRREHGNNEKSE